ncbi:MAG: hypothetical protein NTV49_16285 [Kiritimatiellaeota bacterium]|nr:hypothetical protein [Kiritimatiellota bacterium]
MQPGLDVPAVEDIVRSAWPAWFPARMRSAGDAYLEALPWRSLRARQAEWDWQFGATPAFEADLALTGGAGTIRCRIEKAVVVGASVVRGAAPRGLEQTLPGCLFRAADLAALLAQHGLALLPEQAAGLG